MRERDTDRDTGREFYARRAMPNGGDTVRLDSMDRLYSFVRTTRDAMPNPLDNIIIVLVEPQGLLNVGATARAMKNFGLSRLHVVGDVDFDDEQCRLMASGSKEVLDQAQAFPTLSEAIATCHFVVGTTARRRRRVETDAPRDAASRILEEASTQDAAVLFGRENYGLSKSELIACHRTMSIPTSPGRASLNLAQAVLLVSYELFTATGQESVVASSDRGVTLVGRQWDRLYDETIACFERIGYTHDGNRLAVEQSVRRFLKLGPIQTRDARHLFGLVRRVQSKMDERDAAESGHVHDIARDIENDIE